MQINKIKLLEMLKKEQTSKRYTHTIGVQYTAACMAMKYEYSIENAEVAGILHDCAKCLSDDELLTQCEKHGLEITDIEKNNPYLLHSKLGATYAVEKYGIQDEEISSAITFHTTGKPDMSLLEKIIFVADYIEPGRKITPILESVRSLAFENLDLTVYLILEDTLAYLKEKNKDIDTLTIDSYNYYKNALCMI